MDKPSLEQAEHHFAGVFLVTASGKVVGQRRDNKRGIDNPNRIGTFGGAVEKGENPKFAAWRELTQEETNLTVDITQIHHFLNDVEWRELTEEWEARHFYYTVIADSDLNNVEVYEGQGWAYINGPNDPALIELWRPVTKKLYETLKLTRT